MPAYRPVDERFWEKVHKTSTCWLWTACKVKSNATLYYGHFYVTSGKTVMAHRYAYERLVGPIPVGLTLDHLCKNPLCVNPAHLEPVTNRENVLRGTNFAAVYARRTACMYGHEFTKENTKIRVQHGCTSRTCLACSRRRWHDYDKNRRRRPASAAIRAVFAPRGKR